MFKSSGARRRRQGEATDAGVGLSAELLIQASYFVTAFLFIIGPQAHELPGARARSGILWAGAGMVVATLVTFLYPGMTNYG